MSNHEWIEMDNGICTFGITEYGQSLYAEVIGVEYFDSKEVKIGDTIAEFESIKIFISMDAPISGTVVQINEKLKANPTLFHTSPESEGWIGRVKATTSEVQELFKEMMDRNDYQAYCKICEAEYGSQDTIRKIRAISRQNSGTPK
ncbi:hypothetical protein BGZ46_003963 [Entomortierella lignicola]|nr:hypothetical protein BGZ46_003963 [Entomortierella lignicola]